MKISIIIVNHNGERFLKRFLDTLYSQTVKPYEVILVDTASTDTSCADVNRKYPHVNILKTSNNGYGSAANIGAAAASGEILMFFNEDMYFPSTFLEQMITYYQNLHETQTRVGPIGCTIIPFDTDPNDTPIYLGGNIDFLGFPNDIHDVKKHPFVINGCPFMIETSLFLKSKGFHESIFLYGEDTDLCWRLRLMGYSAYINPNTHLYHFGGGATGGLNPEKIANIVIGAFVGIFSNYSPLTLFFVVPIFMMYYVLMHLAFFIVTKGNTGYNKALWHLVSRIWKARQNLGQMRSFVQKNRIVSDLEILKIVRFIPSHIQNASIARFQK